MSTHTIKKIICLVPCVSWRSSPSSVLPRSGSVKWRWKQTRAAPRCAARNWNTRQLYRKMWRFRNRRVVHYYVRIHSFRRSTFDGTLVTCQRRRLFRERAASRRVEPKRKSQLASSLCLQVTHWRGAAFQKQWRHTHNGVMQVSLRNFYRYEIPKYASLESLRKWFAKTNINQFYQE